MNTWHRLWSNGAFRFGFTVLLLMLVLAVLAPTLAYAAARKAVARGSPSRRVTSSATATNTR